MRSFIGAFNLILVLAALLVVTVAGQVQAVGTSIAAQDHRQPLDSFVEAASNSSNESPSGFWLNNLMILSSTHKAGLDASVADGLDKNLTLDGHTNSLDKRAKINCFTCKDGGKKPQQNCTACTKCSMYNSAGHYYTVCSNGFVKPAAGCFSYFDAGGGARGFAP